MSQESLARATNSKNLEMEPGVVHDADRLAAAASGDALGGLLLRFRESEQPRWGHRIVLILTNRIIERHKLTRSIAYKAALAALWEFHSPHCEVCNGARVRVIDQLKVICAGCEGSGKQLFTDKSRSKFIGAYSKRIDDAMADTHRWMQNSLGAYLGHAASRLR